MRWRAGLLGMTTVACIGFCLGMSGAQITNRPSLNQTPSNVQLTVQLGHANDVTSVAFSPDGRLVLTGSKDMTARLWEAASGNEIRRFEGHTDRVTAVAFSPDGHEVLTGSWDKSARLWDAATGQELRRFDGHTDQVTSVAFSRDGHDVLTGSGDKTARLWDAASGKELQRFLGHSGEVRSVAFSPDGRTVLTGSADTTARLWDVGTGQEMRRYTGHTKAVNAVAFSPDGRYVLTGSDDHTALLSAVASGVKLRRFAGHDDSVVAVAFSPDGKRVLTGGLDFITLLWDASSGMRVRHFQDEFDLDQVLSVAFSPNGREMLIAVGKATQMWEVASGKELRRLEGHAYRVTSVAFSRDGRYLLSGSASPETQTHLWDSETGKELRRFGQPNAWVMSAAFSADGRYVLTASPDHTAHLWDTASGRELRRFKGHNNVVTSVAFSPDGRSVLTGSMDQTVRLWDAASGQELRRFDGHTYWVTAVAFSPDGRTVLSGSADKTVRLWDASSGKELLRYTDTANPLDMVSSVAFSADGRYVLAGSRDSAARLWDAASGKLLRRFVGHAKSVTCVAFSADGRYVLTGSADATARLWDTANGQELRRFEGHTNAFTSVTFSPDGLYALTGNDDGTARLWDVTTGRWLVSLISFDNGGWAVVDPEGRFDTNDLDGGAQLHWVAADDPMRALPLEIFMRDYYTPRLLSRIMNREPLAPVRSIADIKNRVQPDVTIVSVSGSRKHPGRADLVVHAASHLEPEKDAGGNPLHDASGSVVMQAGGLEDLRLFRNGQLVGYRKGRLNDGDFAFADVQLPTAARSVTFTAYAFNSERIKSFTAQKKYIYQSAKAVKPRAWLLQIGANHYRASGCELHGSANDAEQLSKTLVARLTSRRLQVKPTLLVSTDQVNDATKARIRSALASIAAAATPDDVFFLSFSGHGYSNQRGQFYILPADVKGSCAGVDEAMLQSAISAEELTEWLRPIDAGEMTFILDSCDSASSVESNDFKPGPMGSPGLGQLAYDKRMRILAASQPNQAARESDVLHQGLLSYALTELGLKEGQADWEPKDGKIMVGEWLAFGADAVPKSLQSGAVKGARGLIPIGEPEHEVHSVQTPAVFDFSRQDTFVLQ